MTENRTYNDSPTFIPARLESAVHGLNPVADAKDIYDIEHQKWQKEVNQEVEEQGEHLTQVDESLNSKYDKNETYSKTEVDAKESNLQGQINTIKGGSTKSIATLDNEINGTGGIDQRLEVVEELGTISVGGGDIGIATEEDFGSDTPTDLAKVPTVGAIQGGLGDGVYDISARNEGATFDSLEDLLNDDDLATIIPTHIRKGGMTIRFIQSSDNKYVQFRLMSDSFNTTVANWQGVDDEPTAGSENLVKSGGVYVDHIKTNGQYIEKNSVNGSYTNIHTYLLPNVKYYYKNTTNNYVNIYPEAGSQFRLNPSVTEWTEVVFTEQQSGIVDISLIGEGVFYLKTDSLFESLKEDIESKFGEFYPSVKTKVDGLDLEVVGTSNYQTVSIRVVPNMKYYVKNTTAGYVKFTDPLGSNIRVIGPNSEIVVIFSQAEAESVTQLANILGPGNVIVKCNDLFTALKNETIIITANSDINSDADFKGNDAIQRAIDSILDASENKQYIIRCTGEFNFTKITDYKYDAGYGLWFGIVGKNFVHLDGISKNNCIIKGSLSQVLTDVQNDVPIGAGYSFSQSDYGKVIAIQWNANANISNITGIARNIRYPIHTDGSEFGCKDYVATYSDCDFAHEGKYGDAVGTIGGTASGFGLSSGQHLKFLRCRFNGNFYVHTNKDYLDGAKLIVEDCEYFTNPNSIAANDGITLTMMDSPVKSHVIFKGTGFGKQKVVSLGTSLYNYQNAIAENAFDIEMVAKDMQPLAIFKSNNVAPVLRITANDENSSVRFNQNSSAFDKIIGDSSKTIEYSDRWFRICQYGYKYYDGGVGLKGYAQGQWNITESAIRGNYVTSLGKRLGDCSTQNLSLGVVVNGVSYTITFNRDYRNVSNTDIIAEINAVIGSVATCGVFYVDNEYYPEFANLEVSINNDTTAILAGMGVVYDDGKLRRAKNTDGHIDGIALNDAPVGGKCRIMTKGGISLEKPSVTNTNYVLNRKSNEPQYWSIPDGSKWGISTDEDGVFDLSATPKLVIKSHNNKCSII